MSEVDISEAGLDDKAAEFNKLTGLQGGDATENKAPPESEPEVEAKESDDLPGFVNYEDWVAQGKDPDDWRGKNAYKAEYDRIQDNKELKREVSETKEMMKTVVETAEQMRQRDREEFKAELEKQLEQAKKDMDVDAALEAQKHLDALEEQPKDQPPPINPVITDFLKSNPLLDAESGQFNQEFFEDYEALHNSTVDKLTSNGTRPITDAQLKKAMKTALNEAKALNPELFKSQRNDRQGAPAGRSGGKSSKSLSDYQIDNKDDVRNQNAATEMYEMLKAKNPEIAEKFKNNLLEGDS